MTPATQALTGNGILDRLNNGENILVVASENSYNWVPDGNRGAALDRFFDTFGDPDLDDKGEETMRDVVAYCARKGVKFYAPAQDE